MEKVEFVINGQTYRAGKMDAFRQFHVSRRLAPIVPTLIPVFVKVAKEGDLLRDLSGLAEVIQPFAEGLAAMPDDAAEYVFANCLSVVQRQQGDKWAPVWSSQAKAVMFDDIDLGVMVQIVLEVVQDSLGPFIRGLLMSQQGGPSFASTG